jgi:hypothetical protein
MATPEQLYGAFWRSSAVKAGGPGGWPVTIGGEQWNVGRGPSGSFFASNLQGERPARPRSYRQDEPRSVWVYEMATKVEGGWMVDPSQKRRATPDEIGWLKELIHACNRAELNQSIEAQPRPPMAT